MAATTPRTMTIEEYSTYEGKGHVDLIRGEIVEFGNGVLHGIAASAIGRAISNHAAERDLGHALSSKTTYILSRQDCTAVRPDISFLSREHILSLTDRNADVPFPPDLAVEVLAPDDLATDFHAKLRTYIEAGTPIVWVVDPMYKTATVYTPCRTNEANGVIAANVWFLSESDALDGGDVLPGFSLSLAQVFEI